jgi:putative transposase
MTSLVASSVTICEVHRHLLPRAAAYGQYGVAPFCQRPQTPVRHPEHSLYPYLLRDLPVDRSNQVWCADITYNPARLGLLLSDRGDGLVDAQGAEMALVEHHACGVPHAVWEEALVGFGRPEAFNCDQV